MLFGSLAFLGGDAGIAFSTLAFVTTPFFLYGLFGARNCHFYAVTAVQRAEWSNVARLRQAKKLIALLEPLISATQLATAAEATREPTPGVSTPS